MSAVVLKLQPRPGRPWRGGVYVGRGLIAGPLLPKPAEWAEAMTWAAALTEYGHTDFSLPTLAELRALSRVFPRFFCSEVFWSCESSADAPTDALVAHFAAGVEVHWGKHHLCHAIAVRREPVFGVFKQ